MKIADLEIGKSYTLTLVINSATARETKMKKPFLSVVFFDGIDTITGNYWDWSTGKIPEVNTVVDVLADVTEWAGAKQLNVKSMKLNETRPLADFAPSTDADLSSVFKEAYAMAADIRNDTLRELTVSIYEELRDRWLTVPGARSVHHAYIGGTLVHSCSVAKIAKAIAKQIPDANVDLCVAGALLHDVGKLFTYKLTGVTIGMTDAGMMYEHLFIGAEFVGNFAESHVDMENPKTYKIVQLLRHIILSHHGLLELGSPVTPMCIEAIVVNRADGIDASAEQIRAAARKLSGNEKWTEKVFTLNNRQQISPKYIEDLFQV